MIIDRDKTCWLVVADGATAHFFVLQSRPFHIEPAPVAPLRSHASERHGSVPQEKKDRFAAKIAAAITDAKGKNLFQELVVLAPHHMLGEMRHDLNDSVRRLIRLELAGEWANLTPAELAAHLKPHLTPAA